jgi:streptomycin 6-kinase
MPHADAFRDQSRYALIAKKDDGRVWLAELPGIVERLERDWQLTTGAPFLTGIASWVAPAVLENGTHAVLKVNYPHREAREEASGLEFWHGDGAVRLLRSDRANDALLIERCEPGTQLGELDLSADERLLIAADIAVGLWARTPPDEPPFEHVADVTAEWAALLRSRMEELKPAFDPGLVEIGASLLESLPANATRACVIHGDFNPGNVLRAQREPWLAIDAKPMVGDPCYDPIPMLLQVDNPLEATDGATVLAARTQLFADAVGLPAERILAWGVARCVEAALWSVSLGDAADGEETIADALVLARLAGI